MKENKSDKMNAQIEHDNTIMDFFKSMANADRLKITGSLAIQKMTLEQLSAHTGIPAVDLSHHMDKLLGLGIVRTEEQYYRLDTHAVEAMARQTLAQLRPQAKADDFEGEAYEKKVLADFMTPDGKLRALPVQYKKLLVILHYLANKVFEPGVKYTEKEVNSKLSAYFEDTASLRRYLVDNRYLAREKGIYWKPEVLNP